MAAKRSRCMKEVLEEARPPTVERRHLVTRNNRRMSDMVNGTTSNSQFTTLQSKFVNPEISNSSRRMSNIINGTTSNSQFATLQSEFVNPTLQSGFVNPEISMVNARSTAAQLDFGGIPSQNHISTNIELHNRLDATTIQPSEMQYSDDSDSDSDEDDLNEEIDTNGDVNMTKKKGRGPSKPWDDWGKGKKIMIEWDEFGRPIGEYANRFGSKIRSYARNGTMFPLNFTRWDSKANENTLEQIWKEVQANTNAPDIFKPLCFKRIAKSWKAFKNRIKTKYYDVHETDALRFANKPKGVLREQWIDLVQYWGLETSKSVSLRNRMNRKNLFAYSKTGRTPHATIRAQRIKNNLPVDNLSMWLATRGKDGNYDTRDGAADREASIKRRLAELHEEDRENPLEREKIFREIVGEDGHGHALLQGEGMRPEPKRMQFSSLPPLSSHDNEAEIAQLKSKLEEQGCEYQEKINHLQEQITNYAVEVVDLRKDFVELQQQFEERIKCLAHDVELKILLHLQNGINFLPGYDQSTSRRQSSGNGSTSRLFSDDENNGA